MKLNAVLKRLLLFTLMLVLTGDYLNAQSAAQQNIFGVVEGFWLPDVVCELHPGWERIIFDWSEHQPNGPDDWNTLNVDDRWLAAARACDREVVAIFKHTPKWATDGTPGPGVPRGLYLPVDDPNNLWARFVRKCAEYYKSRGVKRFIIYNEPDIDRGTYGFEFEGSLDDYFQMVKIAYLAAKQGNPEAVIHLAGTTYWHDVNQNRRLYLDRLLERITQDPDAAKNDDYFSVASLHIYFRTETVYDIVRKTRELLDQYGLKNKQIWINEMNAGPTDDPLWSVQRPQYQIDLEQQSAYLVQAAALGLAAGADRMAVYKFYDWNLQPGAESFGLLRADQSRRPAFDAWAMVIRHFSDVKSAVFARTDRADAVRVTHADGRYTLVAWARTADSAQLRVSAVGDQTVLLDQYGHTSIVQAKDGQYGLDLAGARCNKTDGCAVGGAVQLLVLPPGDFKLQEITSAATIDLTFQ
jgi:hypothetical protein